MTPIVEIWIIMTSVLTLDTAGKLSLQGQFADDDTARLFGELYAEYHKRPLYRLETRDRQMHLIWKPKS